MIRKILLVAVALVALMATPAAAQYPGLTVNPGTVRPGGNADFAGKGCQPGETVVIRLDGTTVATVTSDTSGEFSGSFVVPVATGRVAAVGVRPHHFRSNSSWMWVSVKLR